MEWRSAREDEVKRIKVDKQVQTDVRARTNADELLSRDCYACPSNGELCALSLTAERRKVLCCNPIQ